MELHKQIDATEQELKVLKQHIDIANTQLFAQRVVVQEAEDRATAAKLAYEQRLVQLYKGDELGPFSLIVGASSISDFYRRMTMLNRMAVVDRDILAEARLAQTEAAYEQQVLEDMRTAMRQMRDAQDERLTALKSAQDEQNRIVAKLTAAERASLDRTRVASEQGRKQWKESSIKPGAKVGFAEATVDSRPHTYLVGSHQPTRYQTTGRSFSAHCSWYGNQFHGRTTASGQIFNQNDLTCASKTLPFGTRLALTRGSRRIIVVVNDRGPFIPGRDLDLSRGAARALGFDGVATVQAEVVKPVR